ncbi:MAG: type I restriction enzyme HsdR N-terminal domain-containing protein [Bacteroidetes bacterium]|nr:type I restriction enzyme HsdR N-terminal domain-containing protein [Bacteroidota bacterium]
MNWFKTRSEGGRIEVFDPLRRKYVTLTPEEEVRQLTAHRLVTEYGYPPGRIAPEYTLKGQKLERRCDLLVFSSSTQPWMMVECKAAGVRLNQSTLDQVIAYSLLLPVQYVLITNGIEQYCAKLGQNGESFLFLDKMPAYE